MKKVFRISLLAACIGSISGCASLELLAVGGISYLVTGKGLSDHALSAVMDQDCAMHHLLSDRPLCENTVTDTDENVLLAKESSPDIATDDPILEVDDRVELAVQVEPVVPRKLSPQSDSAPIENYAVVGSFNDLRFAFERSMLYRNYNSLIVENPESSGTRFRVVIGPLQDKSLTDMINIDEHHTGEAIWNIELCADSLLPPPCAATESLAQLPATEV